MGRYLNRLYCMMVAMVSSYAVNMVYQINTAFAATSHPKCPNYIHKYGSTVNWDCTVIDSANDKQTVGLDHLFYDEGVMLRGASDTPCNISAAVAAMTNTATASSNVAPSIYQYFPEKLSGYTLGSRYLNYDGEYATENYISGCTIEHSDSASVYMRCYFESQSTDIRYLEVSNGKECGYTQLCCETTDIANPDAHIPCTTVLGTVCYTDGDHAGYMTGDGDAKRCVCCPGTKSIPYDTVGSPSILSIYNAAAISSCYITGKFSDDAGYFENKNSNDCGYKQ